MYCCLYFHYFSVLPPWLAPWKVTKWPVHFVWFSPLFSRRRKQHSQCFIHRGGKVLDTQKIDTKCMGSNVFQTGLWPLRINWVSQYHLKKKKKKKETESNRIKQNGVQILGYITERRGEFCVLNVLCQFFMYKYVCTRVMGWNVFLIGRGSHG